MLKTQISATEFATLADALKTEYKLHTDGSYKLDLGPNVYLTDRDPAGLFSALEKEREELKRVKAIADQFEEEKKKAETSSVQTVEELKALFQKELADRDAALKQQQEKAEAERAQQQQANADRLAKDKAYQLALQLFKDPDKAMLALPHILTNVKGVVSQTGEPSIELLDATTGKPAFDQNFENFGRTLSTLPLFKPMLVVSHASGGSANGGTSKGLPSSVLADGKPKTYKDYTPGELLTIKKTNPELFTSLKATE